MPWKVSIQGQGSDKEVCRRREGCDKICEVSDKERPLVHLGIDR